MLKFTKHFTHCKLLIYNHRTAHTIDDPTVLLERAKCIKKIHIIKWSTTNIYINLPSIRAHSLYKMTHWNKFFQTIGSFAFAMRSVSQILALKSDLCKKKEK